MSDDKRLVALSDIKPVWGKGYWGIAWVLNDGETITESTWIVSPTTDITLVSSNHLAGNTTWFWAEAGRKGVSYRFVNRVLTSEGRRFERVVVIEVV